MTSTEDRKQFLLNKLDGKPAIGEIRSDYPGLSIDEAVELKVLLLGCTTDQAREAIEDSRYGIKWM